MEQKAVPRFGSFQRKRKATESVEGSADQREPSTYKYRRENRDSAKTHGAGSDDDNLSHLGLIGNDRKGRKAEDSIHSYNRERHRHRHQHHRQDLSYASRDGYSKDKRSGSSTVGKESDSNAPRRPQQIAADSEAWMVDFYGDKHNVSYGSLHQYSIPQYRRYGHGVVIGIPSSLRLVPEDSNNKQVVIGPRIQQQERLPRPLTSRTARLKGDPATTFPLNPSASLDDAFHDFVRFESDEAHHSSDGALSSDEDQVKPFEYRGVTYRPRRTSNFRENKVRLGPAYNVQEDLELVARNRNAALIKLTREQPLQVAAWHDLLDYQIHVLYPGRDQASLSKSERHRLDEICVSICEKAIHAMPINHPGREDLVLLYMRRACFVEEAASVQRLWMQTSADYPESPAVALAYVDYLQLCPSTDFHTLKSVYENTFAVLLQERQGGSISLLITQRRVHLLLKFTTLVRQAGYDELGLALWQILLSLTSAPQQRQAYGLEDLMIRMKQFWELDIPRIGEADALPFSQWLEGGGSEEHVDRATSETECPATLPHDSAAWLEEEHKLQERLHLPAMLDVDDATDTYRFVMWNDMYPAISCLLLPLPQAQTVSAWLLHLGLPPLAIDFGPGAEASARLQSDDMLRTHSFSNIERKADALLLDPQPLQRIIPTSRFLFNSASASMFETCKSHTVDPAVNGLPRFVQRTLQMLANATQMDDEAQILVGEYLLAFTAHIYPAEVTKEAKTLIKGRPKSMKLYNAFALANATSNPVLDSARHVWNAALSNDVDLDRNAFAWRDWAWTEFRLGGEDRAPKVFLLMVQELKAEAEFSDALSAAQRLRVVQYLRDAFDRCSDRQSYAAATACADMITLLTYLVEDKNILAAVQALQSPMHHLDSTTEAFGACESLLQSVADLTQTHLNRGRHLKLTPLLDFVSKAMAKYSDNSMLLALHSRLIRHDKVNDRLRLEASSFAIDAESAGDIAWSHKITEEIKRWQSLPPSATISSIRALFQTILHNPRSKCRRSAHLWTLRLQFELSLMRQLRNTKESATQSSIIDEILRDGMSALCWNKAWIVSSLHAIQVSGEKVLGRGEIRRVVEMLTEKGMRIRVPFESLA